MQTGVAYTVRPDANVSVEVSRFPDRVLHYWNLCLAEIAADPFPRFGLLVERVLPIPAFRMRTFVYAITEETSVSHERVFVFSAEFFSEYALLYAINEEKREAMIFYLRPTP